jgi:hypothetical protein
VISTQVRSVSDASRAWAATISVSSRTTLTLALALSHAGAWGLLAGDLAQAGRCFSEMTALAQARDQPWSQRTDRRPALPQS